MFIKHNGKLVNTAKIDVINTTEQSNKFDVSMVFPDESFIRESFNTKEEADKRFTELETMLCGDRVEDILYSIIGKINTGELIIKTQNI